MKRSLHELHSNKLRKTFTKLQKMYYVPGPGIYVLILLLKRTLLPIENPPVLLNVYSPLTVFLKLSKYILFYSKEHLGCCLHFRFIFGSLMVWLMGIHIFDLLTGFSISQARQFLHCNSLDLEYYLQATFHFAQFSLE